MRKIITIFTLLTVWINASGQITDDIIQDMNYRGDYLGLPAPGLLPEIFAPNDISGKGRLHCFPSFSIDTKEMYWMIIPPKIMMMKEIEGIWSDPEIAPFSTGPNDQAPFVAHDSTLYFSSTREGGQGMLDIWYIPKIDGSYSDPINMGENINTDRMESHPTVSKNKSIFFTGSAQGKLYDRGIYSSFYEDGAYTTPILLPEPINMQDTLILDYTPFIAPDESYLLFCSNRQNPEKERCHIYVSFKNKNEEWDEPIDLSLKMNFTISSKFPYVSPDGKFLFFSSGQNIYWVDAKIINIERNKMLKL